MTEKSTFYFDNYNSETTFISSTFKVEEIKVDPYYSKNYGPYAIAGRLKNPVLYQPESERQKPEDSR